MGYFKTELMDAISPEYFDNRVKKFCLNSLSSILKALLPEKIKHTKKFYRSLSELLKNLMIKIG